MARWKEEVQLHDGRQILVERMAKAEHSGFPISSRGRDLAFELRYREGNVTWTSDNGTQQSAFDIFDRTPYMVLAIGNQIGFCVGKPDHVLPVRVLKQDGKDWKEVDQASFPLDQALMNLYRHYWGNDTSEDAKGLITWAHKLDWEGKSVGLTPDRMRIIHLPYTVREFYEESCLTCANFRNGGYQPTCEAATRAHEASRQW